MDIKDTNSTQDEDIPIPKIIGLTGGIGSGKTSVARILEEKGFPVYYSDDEAKNIVNKDSILKEKIIELLGNEASQDSEFVFKETALLFELKLNQQCYKSLLITADDNLRIKRTMDRDGKTYREVEAIIQKQMPEKEKCKLADYIIYNNADLESLRVATEGFIEELK